MSEKQVRLDEETWEKLKIMSVKEKKSMKQLIKELVDEKDSRKS